MKKITVKPFINKKTKQMSIAIPKRKAKAIDPTIKFDEDLFVRLEFVRRK